MRILPAAQRDAMFEIYRFCRQVDDIADSSGPRPMRVAQLAGWRDEINDLYEGRIGAKVQGLLGPMRQFGLKREDFLTVIDGMEMDARDGLVAPSMAELRFYCSRVAGAVGLLSVRIFGAPRESGRRLADALGEAVQLTNVLRDVAEDAELGRLYLPRELLDKHGVPTDSLAAALRHPRLSAVCDELADLAEQRFVAASAELETMPRRALRPARLILVVYRRLLARLRQRGFARLDEPVKLSKAEKLWLILRHGLL
jgi:phytoene synthase